MMRISSTALVVSLVAVAMLVAACGGRSSAQRGPVSPVVTGDPVPTFAPLVRLDRRERSWPMSADRFLLHSGLEWAGGPCDFAERDISVSGTVPPARRRPGSRLRPERLGHGATYRVRPTYRDCSTLRPDVYSSDQHTRPYDSADRPVGLRIDEGFNLDIAREFQAGERSLAADGTLTDVPAYFARDALVSRRGAGLRVSYWLLFGRERIHDRANPGTEWREGDWERIDVLARRVRRAGAYRPITVEYRSGDRVLRMPWNEVDRVGRQRSHPVVRLEMGTHTLDLDGKCENCVDWPTWRLLRDVREQPWWGYGGGWGAIGETAETSGPAGPSPYEVGPSP